MTALDVAIVAVGALGFAAIALAWVAAHIYHTTKRLLSIAEAQNRLNARLLTHNGQLVDQLHATAWPPPASRVHQLRSIDGEDRGA